MKNLFQSALLSNMCDLWHSPTCLMGAVPSQVSFQPLGLSLTINAELMFQHLFACAFEEDWLLFCLRCHCDLILMEGQIIFRSKRVEPFHSEPVGIHPNIHVRLIFVKILNPAQRALSHLPFSNDREKSIPSIYE